MHLCRNQNISWFVKLMYYLSMYLTEEVNSWSHHYKKQKNLILNTYLEDTIAVAADRPQNRTLSHVLVVNNLLPKLLAKLPNGTYGVQSRICIESARDSLASLETKPAFSSAEWTQTKKVKVSSTSYRHM